MASKNTRRKSSHNDGQGMGLLIVAGGVIWVIVHLIWWILAALVLIVTGLVVRAILAEQRRRTTAYAAYVGAMADRADRQNDLFMQGDDRGIFGTQGARLMSAIRKGRIQPR